MTIYIRKKYICLKCGLTFKAHKNVTGTGICPGCEPVVAKEVQEAIKLRNSKSPIPFRLMYLFYPKATAQLKMEVDMGWAERANSNSLRNRKRSNVVQQTVQVERPPEVVQRKATFLDRLIKRIKNV